MKCALSVISKYFYKNEYEIKYLYKLKKNSVGAIDIYFIIPIFVGTS